MKYIGIHLDYYGKFWVEVADAKNKEEACEILERNDTNLMIFNRKEVKKLVKLLKTEVPE